MFVYYGYNPHFCLSFFTFIKILFYLLLLLFYFYFIYFHSVCRHSLNSMSPPADLPESCSIDFGIHNTFQVCAVKAGFGLRHLCCYSEKVEMSLDLYNSHSKSGDKTQVVN